MASDDNNQELNLFEVESDHEDVDSDEDDEFSPGKGITKKDHGDITLDTLMDKDEDKYNPILDDGPEDDPVAEPAEATEVVPASLVSHTTPIKAEQLNDPENHDTAPAAPAHHGKSKRMGIPGLTKYIFVRESGGVMSHPSFRLVNEETGAAVMIARKKQMRSPHVYLYSVTGDGRAHLKKLRETEKLEGVLMASSDLTEYRLVIDENGQVEVAGAAFDKTSIFTEMMHGFQPRRLSGIIPQMDPITRRPKPHNIANGGTSLALHLRAHDVDDNPEFVVLRTKEPVFQDGCYRLNFYGRASVPSVKNFQLVCTHNVSDVLCQFGKFSNDEFHLDIKEPITPFQAFAIAICQFNNV